MSLRLLVRGFIVVAVLGVTATRTAIAQEMQSVALDGTTIGAQFDGVGAVSGGGATSVLLKDYPLQQRDQVLDILFKPKFAASMQTLYVEVGGDGNSTQGTEQTHMRSRTDENFSRGYEWWLMSEAKKRNPALTFDACAWSAPAWVGNGQFWSQDMADYYVKWVHGLHDHYGIKLNAIGCRNEKGANTKWVKLFRKTLDANGLSYLPIHAFDNPGKPWMWDWFKELSNDSELQSAVGIIGNHCLLDTPMPDSVRQTIEKLHKPVWNTEEHVYNSSQRHYKDDYDAALGAMHLFNTNYIERGATKIVNWYLVGSTYSSEPYADQPPAMIARSPWSGHYQLKPIIWSYAHYGQFVKVGWHYVPGGCVELKSGGSLVTLKSDENDFSILAETSGANAAQSVSFRLSGGLHSTKLCVWRTTRQDQFVRQDDIAPTADGYFTVELLPSAIYSISTTSGQQKGKFDAVPEDKPFPLPYFDDFDHYGRAASRGYLPNYTADIVGVFELSERPDHHGGCLRQVVDKKAISWAPEWKPYTVIGDDKWTDYEVSADILLDNNQGWAGLMGRVSKTGDGYNDNPDGYYCRLNSSGAVQLYSASSRYKQKGPHERQLGAGNIAGRWTEGHWYNMKMQFKGSLISIIIDNKPVLSVEDTDHVKGLAGLITGGETDRVVASFDNLLIKTPRDAHPDPTAFNSKVAPIYDESAK